MNPLTLKNMCSNLGNLYMDLNVNLFVGIENSVKRSSSKDS